MAPIPRADFDMDNPSSDVGDSLDQDSPMRRQFSEPMRPQSTSTQISQSPEPLGKQIKCDWCGKLLELPVDKSISAEDLLNFHISSDHPDSQSFDYEEGEDGADELELEDEEVLNDASQFEENEETYQAEEGDDLEELNDDGDGEEIEDAEDAEEVEDPEFADQAELAEAEEVEAGEEQEQEEQGTPVASAVNGEHSELDTSKTSSVNIQVAPQAPGKLDMIEWLSNPRNSFPDDFRRRLATWQEADIKDRLPKVWTVHKASNFSENYDQNIAKVEASWQHAFGDKPKKKDGSEPMAAPTPYKTSKVSKGEFLETGNFEELIEMLRKPESLTPDELYAATEAAAAAMKTWQDEYIALDKLYTRTHRHIRLQISVDAKREQSIGQKKRTGHPLARVPEDERDFEDRKESMLYGYKHTFFGTNINEVVSWTPQNPFSQGGFIPTAAQARKMASKVAPEDRNPDGWTPVVRDGMEFVPVLFEKRLDAVPKVTRKRKAAEEQQQLQLQQSTKVEEVAEDTQNESDAAEESEEETRPVKRRARGRGGRRTTLDTYQPAEPPTSAPRGRGGTRARGRGRGRGAGRTTSSRASLEAPQAGNFASPTSYRGRGRRGASIVSSTTQPYPAEETPASLPADSPMPETSPPPKANLAVKRDATAEEMEEARRLKIANSKNPKRTKAMLDHWERFNREGRIRNPKRSKAQIESDRQDDPIKPDVLPRPPDRRRKSTSLVPIPNGNLAPKAPVVAPMAGHMGPGHTLPPIGMAQYAPPNPYAQPPPPPPNVPIGQQLPAQYAPFPYVPYGMSHMQALIRANTQDRTQVNILDSIPASTLVSTLVNTPDNIQASIQVSILASIWANIQEGIQAHIQVVIPVAI
ncbi:hypothetical protein N7466_003898 [Penicillium verhagenii]|uniref:uncharacterized protein n=1 Tax=Penicillium verhagenii TaxID=1562060 RepID=UPI0025456B53|nr:uncharacterized protein N7466_003898 [Penicillium verhagenii]KAJ5934351.1 hypothetical protein N7466_003898 [Penicillium verhagenii]